MGFWMIFLCLLVGVFIGFEFGKYVMSRKVRDILDGVSRELQKTADELKRKKEQAEEKSKYEKERMQNEQGD